MHRTIERGEPWIFGVDIGGTRAKFGVTDCGGQPRFNPGGTEWVESLVKKGPDLTLRKIAEAFRRKVDEAGGLPNAVGIACAGQIGLDGVVNKSANFGDLWTEFPLAKRAREMFSTVSVVENDANAHTLAEYTHLVSRSPLYKDTSGFLITLGTGLGTGRMNRGGILERGEHGWGEELGHLPMRAGAVSAADPRCVEIQCGCGKCGCMEQFVSLQFLARELLYRRSENPNHELYQYSDLAVAATKIIPFAERGDLFALSHFDNQAINTGRAVGELIETRDPKWTLVGGGITDASPRLRQRFMETMLKQVEYFVGPKRMQQVHVDYACLGSDAGWIGGAISAAQVLEHAWSTGQARYRQSPDARI